MVAIYCEGLANLLRSILLGTSARISVPISIVQPVDRYQHRLTWDKVNGQGDVVLFAVHLQIWQHSFNLRVSNIGFVDVGDEIEDGEHRHESPLDNVSFLL
jgi:hypothetical protein